MQRFLISGWQKTVHWARHRMSPLESWARMDMLHQSMWPQVTPDLKPISLLEQDGWLES